MKKTVTLLVLFVVFGAAYGQTGLHIGFHGQYNSIWIQNQNNYNFSEMDYEYKYGALGGFAVGYNFHNNFGVQAEINYAQLGQTYEDILRDFSTLYDQENQNLIIKILTTRDVSLNYAQVPIMFKYIQGEKKDAIKYHMMAGVQVGILMSADQVYMADVDTSGNLVLIPSSVAPQSGVPDFAGQSSVAMEDFFQRFDAGAIIDIGVDIYLNDKTYITPAFRGYYGFLDINSKPTRGIQIAQTGNPYKHSHNAFAGLSLGIHWLFPDVVIGGPKE